MVDEEYNSDDNQLSNKLQATVKVRINVYKIIDEAVENAILYGYSRAHKHVEQPSRDHLVEEIHRQVMNSLCDILVFDGDL